MDSIKKLFDFTKKETAPYGSDVSSGTYECVDCGYTYSSQSTKSLPPCPQFESEPHKKKAWKIKSGAGDSSKDPHPKKS